MSKEFSFYARLGIFLAFALPLAYLGIITAVVIHEVLGHGVWSLLVGGDFTRFEIKPDGFGWAYVDASSTSLIQQAVVYLAGPGSTLVFGILLLWFSFCLRKRFFLSFGVLIVALNCLLEGPPYMFWNAINPLPPGDIGRVLELVPSASLRFSLMAIGFLITFGGIFLANVLLYRKGSDWVSEGGSLRGAQKWIFISLLFVAQTASWFILDWDQIASGLRMIPNIAGSFVTALVLFFLGCSSSVPSGKLNLEYYTGSWKKALMWVWILTILVVIVLFSWLQHGVTW